MAFNESNQEGTACSYLLNSRSFATWTTHCVNSCPSLSWYTGFMEETFEVLKFIFVDPLSEEKENLRKPVVVRLMYKRICTGRVSGALMAKCPLR